jgi:hypothetical protein
MESQMVLNEIVRTCSNVHTANAALASVGGAFASRFAANASHCDLSLGMLASLVVKEYSAHASPAQRADVRLTGGSSDQPIFSGLYYIPPQSSMSA